MLDQSYDQASSQLLVAHPVLNFQSLDEYHQKLFLGREDLIGVESLV